MKILQINAFYGIGSTGKIVRDLESVIRAAGHESYVVCAYSNGDNIQNVYSVYGKHWSNALKINTLITRITGKNGYRNKSKTEEVISVIKDICPDVIHFHVIHGDWICLEELFKYIKSVSIPIVWTFHDCWAFTGRCSHFEMAKCFKWKNECYKCHNHKVYPVTYFFDYSKQMFIDKRTMFRDIEKCTVVTPSVWLAEYVNQSFMKEYNTVVIHNGIDTDLFSCIDNTMIGNGKKVLLGVASSWTKYKGFDDFVELDKLIDHEKYRIVLVGLNDRQMKELPKTIEGIKRTHDQQELVELYNGAYAFLNLTYQDNFPTTNIEALACGLPVITYNTGGSPESVSDNTGFIVDKGDLQGIVNVIEKIDSISPQNCRGRAVDKYDKSLCFSEYLELYNSVCK